MSESYTRGGDTTQLIRENIYAAQTFTPLETHTPYYVDLQLQTEVRHPAPWVEIYLAAPDHTPFGPRLSSLTGIFGYRRARKLGYRFRCKIEPHEFIAGFEYVIIVSVPPIYPDDFYLWVYDKDDAKYARGRRLLSEDGGASWTVKENDDHIFCEFGNPPLPEPDPPPPIDNFASLDILYLFYSIGALTTLKTNVPCFLTCYYTDKKPLKHHTERTVRGITIPWGTYFCFAAWKSVNQLELDDTMYHTFKIPDWEPCQTKWLTFRGTIEDIESPSITPIFEKHNTGPPPPSIEEQNQGIWLVHFAGGVMWDRIGQILYILNRNVVSLSFYTKRVGNPPGIITFTIRKDPDGTILATKLYGNANTVPFLPGWIEVIFDSPVYINERVRILMEWTGPPGDVANYLEFHGTLTDVKPNEFVTRWYNLHGYWTNTPAWDAKYSYSYYPQF